MLARDLIPKVCEKLGIKPEWLSRSEFSALEYIIDDEWQKIFKPVFDYKTLETVSWDYNSPYHNQMHDWFRNAAPNSMSELYLRKLFCAQVNIIKGHERITLCNLLHSIYTVFLPYAKAPKAINRLNQLIERYLDPDAETKFSEYDLYLEQREYMKTDEERRLEELSRIVCNTSERKSGAAGKLDEFM